MDPVVRPLASTVLLVGGLLCAPAAKAAGVSLGGHLKSFAFQEITAPYHLDRAGVRLQLSAWGGEEPVSYLAAIDFELDNRLLDDGAARRGQGFDIYPVELWVQLSHGPVELKIGQQFIFWGRADWVTITDVLTGWDYANMASELEDYRLAPFGARLSWFLADELMLDLVWLPLFSPSRVSHPVPSAVGGLPVLDGGIRSPASRLEHGELGLRLSQSISSWAFDWALCAYQGYAKLPVTTVNAVVPESPAPPIPTALVWQRHYEPLRMVGLDFAKAAGPIVIKGEAAFKHTDDGAGEDPVIPNPRLEYALGLAYTLSEDLSLAAQYVGHALLDYDRAAERVALTAQTGAPPPFVEREVAHEATLLVRGKITDTVGAQLLGLYSISNADFFVLGFVTWELADALQLFVGGVGFGGRREVTPNGRMRDASRLFAELKYSF